MESISPDRLSSSRDKKGKIFVKGDAAIFPFDQASSGCTGSLSLYQSEVSVISERHYYVNRMAGMCVRAHHVVCPR